MATAAHPSRRRYWRYAFRTWTLAAALGATVGAVLSFFDRENDQT
jgi:hypothetical protein